MLSGDGRGEHWDGFAWSKQGRVQMEHSCMPFYPVKWVLPLIDYNDTEIYNT